MTYKEVTQQNGMVIDGGAQVGHDIVLRLAGRQEITGNQFRALVNELVKGVLTVGTGFSPGKGRKREKF